MKFRLTSRYLLTGTPILLLCIFLIYTACQKKSQGGDTTDKAAPLLQQARTWFTNDIVANENKMLATSYTTLPKESPERTFARMGRINKLLDWGKAVEYNQSGISFVLVPVEGELKPFHNKKFEFVRGLIFFRDGTGKMSMNVMEVLSDKDKPIGSGIRDIAGTAFSNNQLKKSELIGNINASILFYDEHYKMISSYRVKNGVWTIAPIQLRNKQGPKKRIVSTIARVTSCQQCETFYLIGFWYDTQTGEIVDYEILEEWDECTEGPPPPGEGYENTGGQPPTCLDDCIDQSNQLSDNAQVVAETVSEEVIPIDGFKKYKNPKWRILKGPTWALYSQENGMVKLIDVQNDIWQWESLTHGTITKLGSTPGGTVSFTNGVGTPSFVPGTQNVLYAGMQLDFDVTYHPICSCGGAGDSFAYTLHYQSNAIWSAKP